MELELLTHCPVCSGKQFDLYLETQDHSVSHGTFQIVSCKKCKFLFTNPRPPEKEIGKYYDSEAYLSHHDEAETLMTKVYNRVRKVAVNDKIALLKKYDTCPKKHVLDIGCGTGFFLSECKQKGWEISGTEPDDDARNAATKRTGKMIQSSIFTEQLEDQQYSAITMWHVLEHVHRLGETLDWIHHHLTAKGTLFVAVPNPDSHDAKTFGKYWAAYDVPRHLYHFSKDSFERLMQHHNFHVVDMKCMLFDAYYVSLLSNQYKSGAQKIVGSIISGTLSNIKGIGTTPHNINTSSIIYLVQKR